MDSIQWNYSFQEQLYVWKFSSCHSQYLTSVIMDRSQPSKRKTGWDQCVRKTVASQERVFSRKGDSFCPVLLVEILFNILLSRTPTGKIRSNHLLLKPKVTSRDLVSSSDDYSPQAPDRFNPKVRVQTCGIIQKLYETKHIETMTFGKSVMAHFSKTFSFWYFQDPVF